MFRFGLMIVLVVFLSLGKIQARCCITKPINCFDCDSSLDVRCKDPFNRSAMPEDHPPVMTCNACCVKWVRNSRTPKEIIRRTCISQFQVNLFMIDKGCMQEKSKTGHICFCEEELCNNTSNLFLNSVIFIFTIIIAIFSVL